MLSPVADPEGKHVIIIEDLIDTGGTLMWIKDHLKSKNCASVKFVTLLSKKARRSEESTIKASTVVMCQIMPNCLLK